MINSEIEIINSDDYSTNNQNATNTTNSVSGQFYSDGTPFNLNRNEFDKSIYDYLSNIAAVDLISTKNIDALVCENEKFSKDKTKEFNAYLKDQFLEKKIYHLAKYVAINGYSILFFHPTFNLSKYKFAINHHCSIIKLEKINNEIKSAQLLVKFIDGISISPIYALVDVDDKCYKTQFYDQANIIFDKNQKPIIDKNAKEIKKEELQIKVLNNELVDVIFDSLNSEHNLGFVPIFLFCLNDDMNPLIRNIDNDLNELFSIAQKTYDESHFMGTKVKTVNSSLSDYEVQNKEATDAQRMMASSSVLYGNNLFDENGTPQIDVVTKTPIWQMLNDAFKQKINFILKKIGISSDTDSKGTVQQSISEVIRQNEYSYNNQNYRNLILQNFLQDTLTKIYQANFNDQDEIKVISSQSLGMSEFEKLNYVITAKQNNLMDDAHAYSIISGKNYIESLELIELFNLNNVDDSQNQKENFNLDQQKNEIDEIEEGIENEKEQEENI